MIKEDNTNISIGQNRRNNKVTAFNKTTLGGKDQLVRASGQRQGNQRMANRYEEIDYKKKCAMYAEEATKKVMKKLKEKTTELSGGKTDTGQRGDTVEIQPTKPELTGYH